MLLFYDPLGSQWLCRSVQFSPHLILFYCTLAALLLGNGGGWRRHEKLCSFFPRESSVEYKKKLVPTVILNLHQSKRRVLCFTVRLRFIWRLLPWSAQRFDGELKSARVHSRSVSACVCLPVGVCTCDRAPHCCSDVSSLCLRPMTVTPSLTGPLLGKQGVWASPSLRSSISQPPVLLTPTFPSPNLHSGWNAESCCWPVAVVWWC